MKKGIFLILTVLGVLFSCSKDDNSELKASMDAQIDGANWSATTRVTVQNGDKFIITGTALNGKTLEITIYGTSEGTYQGILQCGAIYKETIGASLSDAYLAISGTVELTSVNTSSKEISGTFNFTVTRLTSSVVITNGSFNKLKYTVTP